MALTMLSFHEEREQTRREALADRRHTEIQLAIAKAGLLASGKGQLALLFPQFVDPGESDDGPSSRVSDIAPEEARRIDALLNQGGSLGFDDLFDDDDLPQIDERVRNG